MRTKRQILTIFIAIIFVAVFAFIASAYTYSGFSARLIISTPLYKEADFNSEKILEEIQSNEIIEIREENFKNSKGELWQKIVYNNVYEGYIPYGYIYFSTNNIGYTVQVVKARSMHIGEKINVYSYYTNDSEIIHTFTDGEKINLVVEQSKDYGDFSKVIILKDGKGEIGFVKTENITAGLSYNQTIAVILTGGLIAILIIVGITVAIVMRKKRKQ